MKFQILDMIVLNTDMPRHGLKRGDLGTIVELHGPESLPEAVEVEFVSPTGNTESVRLKLNDIRPVS
jgi:hypothetical protein